MSISYLCKKCNYSTVLFSDLKRHINKKKTCSKNELMFVYSEDQALILTLIPYFENKHQINIDEVNYLKNSEIIYNNKIELFNILEDIDKHKIKKCRYCENTFSKIIDLKKHILIKCFFENITKSNNNNTNTNNITLTNSNNNIITINNNNITNYNIEVNPVISPIPFDEKWDISKIDSKHRTEFIVSKEMYTSLLEEILKNEINLNVIINKDNKTGMVYKNNIDKYIQMKANDIVLNTMNKLKEHLLEMNQENTTTIKNILDYSRQMINQKYNDYQKNNEIQDIVKGYFFTIYNNQKDSAVNIAKNVITKY